ncbi:MAG: hypothetical protein RR053_07975, partial [Evtepia sp.]
MPTSKPRFSITLTEELYKKVNAYQHEKRFSTQTKAVIDLIERGAASLGLGNTMGDISDLERACIEKYRTLDARGKETVDTIFNLECTRCEKPHLNQQEAMDLTPDMDFIFEKEYSKMNKDEKLNVLLKELEKE